MSDMPELISDCVEKSAIKVFDSMAGLNGQTKVKASDASDVLVDGVAGMVGFAGPVTGVVYLIMSDRVAKLVAAKILGTDDVGPDEIKDVVGELTNMVTGGLKNDLAASGYDSKLTIPTFITAKKSKIAVKNAGVATSNVIELDGIGETIQVRVLARAAA